MRHHMIVAAVAAGILVNVLPNVTAAGQFGVFRRADRAIEYQNYRSPSGNFSIEFPKRDWTVGPTGMKVLAQFTNKQGAAVLIEHETLEQPWNDADTGESTAQVMIANLKRRYPQADAFSHEVRKGSHGSIVIVELNKPSGVGSQTEKARFYFLPSGVDFYTITCTAPVEAFPRLAEVFEHIALSFKPAASSRSGTPK